MTVGPKAEDHVQHGPSNYFVLEETNGVVAYATGGTDARAQRSLISDLLLQTEITYSSTVGGELLTDIGWFRSAVPFAPARARSILAGTHLLADANGYFPAGSGYGALVPARLMDTSGPGTVDGQYWSPILGLVDGARCSPAWGCAA